MQSVSVRWAEPVFDDMVLVYNCRFESEASRMFSDLAIPSVKTHIQWMTDEINSGRSKYVIGSAEDSPIGFVRFARGKYDPGCRPMPNVDGLWSVSLALKSDHRGRGIGTRLYAEAEDFFVGSEPTRPLTLLTWARDDNLASWKLFERVGWTRHVVPDFREVVSRTFD